MTEDQLNVLKIEISKLQLEEGDYLAVFLPVDIHPAVLESIKLNLNKLPFPSVIFSSGIKISVVHREEENED